MYYCYCNVSVHSNLFQACMKIYLRFSTISLRLLRRRRGLGRPRRALLWRFLQFGIPRRVSRLANGGHLQGSNHKDTGAVYLHYFPLWWMCRWIHWNNYRLFSEQAAGSGIIWFETAEVLASWKYIQTLLYPPYSLIKEYFANLATYVYRHLFVNNPNEPSPIHQRSFLHILTAYWLRRTHGLFLRAD